MENKLIGIIYNNIKDNQWFIIDKDEVKEVKKEKIHIHGQDFIRLKVGNEIYRIKCEKESD